MVKRVKTIPTMAFQLWLRDDMKSLGWNELPTTMSGFNKPFDTWADMRHLIREESWPLRPKSLLYFCGAMPALRQPGDRNGKAFERRCREQVRAAAIAWTELELKRILPDSVNRSGKFRWDLLMDCRARERYGQTAGPSLLDSQFYTANINPSDHYVLSVPGSVEFRISPLDYTYDNMTIAGDWTDCGLNLGCVESAFISGRLAAHAISSSPALEDIVGYDHP
jgi:hypothetical protein